MTKTVIPTRATLVTLLLFIAKWTVAGLAFAGVLLWLLPDLRSGHSSPEQASVTPPTAIEPEAQRKSEPPATETPQTPQPPAPAVQSYADAVSRSAPSVVNIYTARLVTERLRPQGLDRLLGNPSPAMRQRVEGSLGSGVIVDSQGHVVTNHHVIANAQEIRLQLSDGRVASAALVGDDPESDLALLKIELPKLPAMPMGRSDKLRVGDVALAIGNPYGLSQTVTLGIISATGRDQLGLTQFESFIQTDAAINVGNSGGALINAQGELIGINTAVLGQQRTGSEGISFAIPVNMVRGVVDQIIKHGRVLRGWLGVSSVTLTAERATALRSPTTTGVEITEVYDGSPAARANLRRGDILTSFNGVGVREERDAMNRVAGLKPGSTLRIQGYRGEEKIDLRVAIDERKPGQ
ncbi:MAG TPA: trypsin-like peptidase domain-containing protein [Steroidobacteraceae bacterium]|nr:trypsin-like peptidase domain-containing protein [Steroidobacteraceae bacterium]